MSGKFVSAGSLDQITERDNEWLRARQELETKQKERENRNPEHDGKTLFEVLQANKAAKEEAFQESIKLKNQFRALNDDEVEFLTSQAEAAKAKEQAIRQENSEQLELFRQKQYAANKIASESSTTEEDNKASVDVDTDWTTSKKRKRAKQKESIKGVKVARSSSEMVPNPDNLSKPSNIPQKEEKAKSAPVVAKKQGLCLVDYGSDYDSES